MSLPPAAFIVGTGRCGSTLLSDVLRGHPDVLSLSELFSSLSPTGFPAGPVDGEELWRVLTVPRAKAAVLLRHRVVVPELLFRPEPGGRYADPGSVPPILLTTLPHLTDDPIGLLDELEAVVRPRPSAPAGQHYRAVFEWLCDRFGRRRWVERSGGSLRFVGEMLAAFPDARFVHLHRSGPACARSMHDHPMFRLGMVATELTQHLGFDPYHVAEAGGALDATAVPPDLAALLPSTFDARALAEWPLPVERFGVLWSSQVVDGCRALRQVRAGHVRAVRYEELVANPALVLRDIASFLGVEPQQPWLDWAAGLVRPAEARAGLPAEVQRRLERACAAGARALLGSERQGAA